MANTEQRIYPQAYLAMGNGDLIQVTDFTISLTNGAKQKHSLRRRGAGIAFGVEETTVTFNAEISEDGPERNYWKNVIRRTIHQIRGKVPGGKTVLTVNGAFSQVNLDGPLDDATKIACTFVGKMEEPEA